MPAPPEIDLGGDILAWIETGGDVAIENQFTTDMVVLNREQFTKLVEFVAAHPAGPEE